MTAGSRKATITNLVSHTRSRRIGPSATTTGVGGRTGAGPPADGGSAQNDQPAGAGGQVAGGTHPGGGRHPGGGGGQLGGGRHSHEGSEGSDIGVHSRRSNPPSVEPVDRAGGCGATRHCSMVDFRFPSLSSQVPITIDRNSG